MHTPLRPPDIIHVTGVPRPSPFFALFRLRVLYQRSSSGRQSSRKDRQASSKWRWRLFANNWDSLVAYNFNSTTVSRKSAYGWSTLQVCQRGGWALFRMFPHLTTKGHPRHVYSNSKPSKQIIGHKITYNRITSSFEVKS